MILEPSPMAIIGARLSTWPVMVGDIATDLGIGVRRIPLGPAIAGQLMPDRDSPSGFVAIVNSDDPVTRQKFTLAHEIAHYVLHRDLIVDGVIDDAMYRSDLGARLETQANQLAADIIMPVGLVGRALLQTKDPGGLARMFHVSEQAMKIRLQGMRIPA